MDIVRKYLIPLFQAPDAPAPAAQVDAPPVIVADAPVVEAAVPEAQDPPVDPPAPAAPAEHGNKGKQPWFLQRISEETSKRVQTETELAAERRRADEATALLARLQADPAAPAVPPAGRHPVALDPSSPEFRQAVQQEAARDRFFEDTTAVKNAGLQKFGAAFENTLNILTAVGVTTDDVVADILAVDKANAHILIDKLGQDPEKASALARMNSRTRIAELTRMSMGTPAAVETKPAAPAVPAKQVSRAPAPPPPVEPSASKVVDWRTDDASDADFDAGFKEMMVKRNARR